MAQKPMVAYGLDNFRCDSDDDNETHEKPKEINGEKHLQAKNAFTANLQILRVETRYDLSTPSAQKVIKGTSSGHTQTFYIGPNGLIFNDDDASNDAKKQMNIPYDDLECYKMGLGAGAFGSVVLAKHKETGQKFALKTIREKKGDNVFSDDDESDQNKLIWAEFKAIYESDHPNLLKVHNCYFRDYCFYMLLDYCNCGSLKDVFKVTEGTTERMMSVIVEKILKGLNYLQKEKHIIHRDIKPENILVDYDPNTQHAEVKIGDFGLCGHKKLDINSDLGKTMFNTVNGTTIYLSPERLQGCSYNYNSDIWSLGVLTIELMTKVHPLSTLPTLSHFDIVDKLENIQNDITEIIEKYNATTEKKISPEFRDFVLKCCEPDKDKRPFADELLHHPWITKFKDGKDNEQLFSLWLKQFFIKKKSVTK
ncbi:hypothetical protein FDP41_010785 [Naegleria fowleri]|uniref:mitogen-activated protein kinase kinase n=1 Tax=Naegleria fowleri TaxID=5763 RepID=A0A6A5C4Y3_NAEFO|nr:uncharacterized protein FDP41_010785 [Naegleria fowleri]KAF0982806.1 hypothetical protein FDP41_010785 [Naegleria fowleri]CAG4710451.1 unnamed protein product [Naegleria fowleri]